MKVGTTGWAMKVGNEGGKLMWEMKVGDDSGCVMLGSLLYTLMLYRDSYTAIACCSSKWVNGPLSSEYSMEGKSHLSSEYLMETRICTAFGVLNRGRNRVSCLLLRTQPGVQLC